MVRLELRYAGSLTPEPAYEGEEFDRVLDAAAEELLAVAGVSDPIISATLSTGEVAITLTIEAETQPEAFDVGYRAVMHALKAAGAELSVEPSWLLSPA